MSGPEREGRAQPPTFEAAPFNASADLCGDPVGARLRVLLAGNQYMAVPDLVEGFVRANPDDGPVFYETLPPGIVTAQVRAGQLRIGCLELRFTPDVVAASPRALAELSADGLVDKPRTYASNTLALLVRSGNPAGITSVADLGRPGLRVALPDPKTEGIGRLALEVLAAAGGPSLRDAVMGEKRQAGETILTTIHHRQTPAWLVEGRIDVGIVWETEARYQSGIGTPVVPVAIDEGANQRGEYAAAIVRDASHRLAAERFLDHLTDEPGRTIYAHFGFSVPPARRLLA